MKVFVYGTLMRGEPAHALLGDARFLGAARTEPRYALVLLDGYPGLVEGGDTAVAGELYELADDEALLRELDCYEDAPELYARELRRFGEHEAWVYLLRPEHAAGRPPIASGDWRRR
jgi:gamma-glutamylaminecyclotransferase